jgi:hypothetical protein
MRKKAEIEAAENEFFDRVWFERKKVMIANIADGIEKMPPKDIVDGMRKAYQEVEAKYGRESLTVHDDFEWGMVNGTLSTLRWVLGDDWENLDT